MVAAIWLLAAPAWAQPEPPSNTPPAETPPAETPPAETPPAETPPGDTPPAENPPDEAPPAPAPPAPYPAQPQPYPPQPYPPQPYQPQPYEPAYTPPPPPAGYGQPYQPAYGAPPLRPTEPPPKGCCLWSLRYDPFDLISGQITLEGEIALGSLPLSIEIVPSWIFDNFADGVDESGIDMALRFGWYIQGDALRGFFLKAHAGYQHFEATIYRGDLDGEQYFGKPAADPDVCDPTSGKGTCTSTVSSFILGLMLGNSAVFGDDGGFALTGGLGVGVAVAQQKSLRIDPCTNEDLAAGAPPCDNDVNLPGATYSYYEGAGFGRGGRVNILGSLSLGVTF